MEWLLQEIYEANSLMLYIVAAQFDGVYGYT